MPKIEICLKQFSDKNCRKQPVCLLRTLRVPQCFDEFFDSKHFVNGALRANLPFGTLCTHKFKANPESLTESLTVRSGSSCGFEKQGATLREVGFWVTR